MNESFDDKLMQAAKALETEVAPERDLWPEIESSIARPSRSRWNTIFAQAAAVETVIMPRPHFAGRQLQQSFHAFDVIRHHRIFQVVQQLAVVNHVAGKELAAAGIVQTDGTRRMPGQVPHFEGPVAEIDDVAMLDRLRLRAGPDGVFIGAETGVGNRLEIAVRHETECGRAQDHLLIALAQGAVFLGVLSRVLQRAVEVVEQDLKGRSCDAGFQVGKRNGASRKFKSSSHSGHP